MKKRFTAGVLLAIFTFLFLETEYLFVNIMGTLSNSQQAVRAQGIVLGTSVIGFLLYALFYRIKSAAAKKSGDSHVSDCYGGLFVLFI